MPSALCWAICMYVGFVIMKLAVPVGRRDRVWDEAPRHLWLWGTKCGFRSLPVIPIKKGRQPTQKGMQILWNPLIIEDNLFFLYKVAVHRAYPTLSQTGWLTATEMCCLRVLESQVKSCQGIFRCLFLVRLCHSLDCCHRTSVSALNITCPSLWIILHGHPCKDIRSHWMRAPHYSSIYSS